MSWSCIFFSALCASVMSASAADHKAVEAEFPLDYREGFIWLTVTSPQSSTPLNFILDSGAGVSTINAETADRLNLRDGQRVAVKGVGSTTAGRWPQVFKASLGDVRLPRRYLVVDLCSLQASCSYRVDGLLGADFLDGRVVQLDFAERKLRLLRSSSGISGEVIELRNRRGIWQVPLSVNDSATAWFRLDTGCASALQWVVTGSVPQTSSSKVSVALTEMTLPVTQATARLGATKLSDLPTSIHRSEIFSGEAGLVGIGLLSRFSAVTLDGKANRLILTPAAHP